MLVTLFREKEIHCQVNQIIHANPHQGKMLLENTREEAQSDLTKGLNCTG